MNEKVFILLTSADMEIIMMSSCALLGFVIRRFNFPGEAYRFMVAS